MTLLHSCTWFIRQFNIYFYKSIVSSFPSSVRTTHCRFEFEKRKRGKNWKFNHTNRVTCAQTIQRVSISRSIAFVESAKHDFHSNTPSFQRFQLPSESTGNGKKKKKKLFLVRYFRKINQDLWIVQIIAGVCINELLKHKEFTVPRWLWVIYCIDASTYFIIYFSIAMTHVFEKARRLPVSFTSDFSQ